MHAEGPTERPHIRPFMVTGHRYHPGANGYIYMSGTMPALAWSSTTQAPIICSTEAQAIGGCAVPLDVRSPETRRTVGDRRAEDDTMTGYAILAQRNPGKR